MIVKRQAITGVLIIAALGLMSSAGDGVRHTEHQTAPNGQLVFVKLYEGRTELDSLYKIVQVPLVLINNQILIPQVPCIDPRRFGAEDEQRSLGGDTEKRDLGGDTEKRNLGGETEKRDLGGDTEKRNLGGDTEKRNLGGETERRDLGGDTEKRNLGGETEKRDLGGDTEKRNLGGEIEKRDLGGDTEKRNLGGETENRDLGGATEDRSFGGAIMKLACSPLPGGKGFRIIDAPRVKIEVFDGISLREVLNGVVEY